MAVRFSTRELRDLLAAWLALGLAFALFLERPSAFAAATAPGLDTIVAFGGALLRSLLTVGVGFLLHELAHKVVAVRFGQIAEFRADYGMLGLAIAAGLAGFLFAAPGAVYHRGRITPRENGLIALAGPVTNLALVAVFAPLLLAPGFLGRVGLFELMRMTPKLKEMVLGDVDEQAIRHTAVSEGMVQLSQDAMAKLRSGMVGVEALLSLYADLSTEYGDSAIEFMTRS